MNQPTSQPAASPGDSPRPFASLRGLSEVYQGPGKREVDLYVRTYTTLLESSGDVAVASFEPAHLTASPSLHAGMEEREPDLNAMIYALQRLPACIVDVRRIVLGQTTDELQQARFGNPATWTVVSAPGRRRRWSWDGGETLAATVASTSDLDDLVPTLVAFQVEWNKLHRLIRDDAELEAAIIAAATQAPSPEQATRIGEQLLMSPADWERLRTVWGEATWPNLARIADRRKQMMMRMLGRSYLGYTRATRSWWSPIADLLRERGLEDRPVYFVSSNTHSIVNVLSGVARRRQDALFSFIRDRRTPELVEELDRYEAGGMRSSLDNLLYFAAREYFAGVDRTKLREERAREERERGIDYIETSGAVDVGVQIFDLARLDPASFDPRLLPDSGGALHPEQSRAVIVNVNYPLGLGAYHLMTQVATSIGDLRGIYILGKAATLNGRIGDVMISNVVYDEHSGNTYWFENCFSYASLAPYLVYGAALDNQRAITVKGTFLQNRGYLDVFYRENFTVVEMEAGPYLSALYEDLFLERHPTGAAVSFAHAGRQTDLGIIHYASDTPYTRAQTLGARGLSYHGMDSTYASTIAILRRIFLQAGVMTDAAPGESGPW